MPGRGGTASGAPGTAARGVAPGAKFTSGAFSGTVIVDPSGARVPSKLTAGDRPTASASKPMLITTSDVRIARLLGRSAGMGHRALARRPNLLEVFPQVAGSEFGAPRLPRLGAGVELSLGELDLEGALLGVEGDDVAVANQRDRPADGGFRAHMADAEAAGRAGEAPVGNER